MKKEQRKPVISSELLERIRVEAKGEARGKGEDALLGALRSHFGKRKHDTMKDVGASLDEVLPLIERDRELHRRFLLKPTETAKWLGVEMPDELHAAVEERIAGLRKALKSRTGMLRNRHARGRMESLLRERAPVDLRVQERPQAKSGQKEGQSAGAGSNLLFSAISPILSARGWQGLLQLDGEVVERFHRVLATLSPWLIAFGTPAQLQGLAAQGIHLPIRDLTVDSWFLFPYTGRFVLDPDIQILHDTDGDQVRIEVDARVWLDFGSGETSLGQVRMRQVARIVHDDNGYLLSTADSGLDTVEVQGQDLTELTALFAQVAAWFWFEQNIALRIPEIPEPPLVGGFEPSLFSTAYPGTGAFTWTWGSDGIAPFDRWLIGGDFNMALGVSAGVVIQNIRDGLAPELPFSPSDDVTIHDSNLSIVLNHGRIVISGNGTWDQDNDIFNPIGFSFVASLRPFITPAHMPIFRGVRPDGSLDIEIIPPGTLMVEFMEGESSVDLPCWVGVSASIVGGLLGFAAGGPVGGIIGLTATGPIVQAIAESLAVAGFAGTVGPDTLEIRLEEQIRAEMDTLFQNSQGVFQIGVTLRNMVANPNGFFFFGHLDVDSPWVTFPD